MLSAIQFDHKPERVTREVAEVSPDRRLPPEVMLFERRLPQMQPEFLLGFGHIPAERSCARHTRVDNGRSAHSGPPPLTPPRRKRGEGNQSILPGSSDMKQRLTPPRLPQGEGEGPPQAVGGEQCF